MTVRDTSLEAFREAIATGLYNSCQSICYACIKRLGPGTRRETSERTGLEINVVCSAINELVKSHRLMDWRVVQCKTTGRQVHLIEIYDSHDQPTTCQGFLSEPIQGKLL